MTSVALFEFSNSQSCACVHILLRPHHLCVIQNTHSLMTRYLDVEAAPSFGKAAFLPQAAAVIAAGAGLCSDVPFALFVQTLAFVALNKVYALPKHCLLCIIRCMMRILLLADTLSSTLSGSSLFSLWPSPASRCIAAHAHAPSSLPSLSLVSALS